MLPLTGKQRTPEFLALNIAAGRSAKPPSAQALNRFEFFPDRIPNAIFAGPQL
jgi:hypothetical protein